MLVDYVKTTYICSTQQLNDNSLPLIPTPPLIMAVNIGAAECRPLPSDPPWLISSSQNKAWHSGTVVVDISIEMKVIRSLYITPRPRRVALLYDYNYILCPSFLLRIFPRTVFRVFIEDEDSKLKKKSKHNSRR